MGHDIHFLSRLERVDGTALNLALGLYRDTDLLKYTLAILPVDPNADVIALPLRPGDDPPMALVSRRGKFITCLGEGMRPSADTAVARFEHLERLMGERHALREVEAQGRERMVISTRRLFNAGPWLPREDMENLLIVYKLMSGEMLRTYGKLFEDAYRFHTTFRPRDFRALGGRERARLAHYWKCAWGAAHCQVITLEASLRVHALYPTERSVGHIVRDALQIVPLGHEGHLMRAGWALARMGTLALPELETWYLASNESDAPGEGKDPFNYLGGILAPFGFLALAVRQPDLSDTLHATLQRLVGPTICQEIRGLGPRQVHQLFHGREGDVPLHTVIGAIALSHFAEAERGYPTSHAELSHVLSTLATGTPHPEALAHTAPLGPTRKRPRPDLTHLPTDHPIRTAIPFGLYGSIFDDAHRVAERFHLMPAIAHLDAAELFLPRACLDDLQDSLQFNTSSETVREILTSFHLTSRRSRPAERTATPGRNDPCGCGSGQKYKRCCGQ